MFERNKKQSAYKLFLYRTWHGNSPFGKWFGPGFGGFGQGGFGAARFERGDLKYVILDLLQNKPRHGYDIIQELEKKFHGFYSPSPGSVYPILQLLEDQEYVTSNQQSGKKIYTITEAGKKFLSENAEEVKNMQSRMRPHWEEKHGANMHALRDEIRQTAQHVFCNAAEGALNNPETVNKLQAAFAHFRSEIEKIFAESEKKPTEEK